jgi:hypothetical protein
MRATEDLEMTLLGYRISLAFASFQWSLEDPWVVCLADEVPREVLESLGQVHQYVVPISECEYSASPAREEERPRVRWYHGATSRRALSLRLDDLRWESEDLVEVEVSYSVGELWGAGTQCEIRKINGVWIPETCWGTWIS